MQALIIAALVAQIVGVRGYTLADDSGLTLATTNGRYTLELGWGCDGMNISEDVIVVAGSGGVASLTPIGADVLCDVFIGAPVSDEPCAVDANGECAFADEPQ